MFLARSLVLAVAAVAIAMPAVAQPDFTFIEGSPDHGDLPRPFNVGDLDLEDQVAYFMSPDLPEPQEGDIEFQVDVALSTADYHSMMGIVAPSRRGDVRGGGGDPTREPGSEVVGSIRCFVSPHNPHIGRTGTVKAKASGSCTYSPHWPKPQPAQRVVRWTLHMKLDHVRFWTVAYQTHIRKGWNPQWHQNMGPYQSPGGTQVDSYRCVNGVYHNKIFIVFSVPPPFFTTTPVVNNRQRPGIITACPD